jgi:GNAT superfamily N-acetyltransferase
MQDTNQKLTLIPAGEAMKPLIIYLAVGRDENLEAQLIKKSHQPNILKYTPKDAKKRFGSPEMFKQWLAKGREIHWLLGADNDLAGIIWYGKSDFPLDIELPEIPEETFAIRLYDGYTGHGLARPFMELSLKTAVQSKQARDEKITGIWLQTDFDNPAAVAAYTKFGYQEVARDDKRVTMVLDTSRIREYM